MDLINRDADWSVRYGATHTAVVNLRRQIGEIRKSIYEELGRIRETLKSEYEISNKRQEEAETALGSLISQSTQTNQAQVALFSLEAAAQSYRKLYDNFLQQHTQSVQQQTYPISDARPISSAYAYKTGPRPLSTGFLTIFAGAGLGLGLGTFREIMDRGSAPGSRSKSSCDGMSCIGSPRCGFQPTTPVQWPASVGSGSGGSLTIQRRQRSLPRIMSFPSGQWSTIADAPSSPYAEAIRAIKLTVDLNGSRKPTKVIGITSCLAGEGKSTIAAGMASIIAQSGARCILVDGDVRNPTLSRALAPGANAGLLEASVGDLRLSEVLWDDPNTRLAFLPTVNNPKLGNPIDILASKGTKQLIKALEVQCDYIIVDLPPLASAVDVRTTSSLIDSYILVVEWGATKMDAVQYALRHAPNVHSNLAGAVLNKVDMDFDGSI